MGTEASIHSGLRGLAGPVIVVSMPLMSRAFRADFE
jgi:hypothetical protein